MIIDTSLKHRIAVVLIRFIHTRVLMPALQWAGGEWVRLGIDPTPHDNDDRDFGSSRGAR